ncbi:MAG: Rho termination factor N-terminal domain-containing protein [Ilumatobacteraceae bacterium]
MTAQALEQSVLKSKDKAQLIAIAEALGVKATSRTKKSDLIDQILTKTGGSAPSNGGAASSAPPAPAAPAPQETQQPDPAPAAGNGAAEAAPASAPAPAPAEPADEPKAEWELALDLDGGSGSAEQPTSGDQKAGD